MKKLPEYKPGPPGRRNYEISHLFFVDDLKTYATDIMGAKAQFCRAMTKGSNPHFFEK